MDLITGFNGFDKGNCKTRREYFKFCDLVSLILEILLIVDDDRQHCVRLPNEWQSLPRRCNIWYRSLPCCHDDVIKWKHFPRNWPFLRGIHRWPVNSPHKGQWRGALMFSLICTRINGWVNNGEAGDLRRHRDHYDVIMYGQIASNIHVSEIYRFSCNCVWLIFM